jgi:hypothetical protein
MLIEHEIATTLRLDRSLHGGATAFQFNAHRSSPLSEDGTVTYSSSAHRRGWLTGESPSGVELEDVTGGLEVGQDP